MARNIKSVLSSLTHHKEETRLNSYMGISSHCALFMTRNPEAKLSLAPPASFILNSQLHFQRLPGVLSVLFSLAQCLVLSYWIWNGNSSTDNPTGLWQWTFNLINWTCKFIVTNPKSRMLVQWKHKALPKSCVMSNDFQECSIIKGGSLRNVKWKKIQLSHQDEV